MHNTTMKKKKATMKWAGRYYFIRLVHKQYVEVIKHFLLLIHNFLTTDQF